MKKKTCFSYLLLLLTFAYASCRKGSTIDNGKVLSTASLPVKNGILNFKSFSDFFQTMVAVNSMTPEQRQSWEKQMGFKSLRSLYNEFNSALDQAEIARDKNGFYEAKEKYKKAVVWDQSGTSYDINCTGLLESNIVNADGLACIGGQLIQFKKDSIIAHADNIKEQVNRSSSSRVLWSNTAQHSSTRAAATFSLPTQFTAYAPSVVGDFAIGQGAEKESTPVTSGAPEALGAIQARIFTFRVAGHYRGFCTIKYSASHRNWLGIWRRVRTFGTGLVGPMSLKLSNQNDYWLTQFGTPVGFPPTEFNPEFGPNWAGGNEEENEAVVVVSKYLKENPVQLSFLSPGYTSQFTSAQRTIDDDSDPNSYWQVFAPFDVNSLGGGFPFGAQFSTIGLGPVAGTHAFKIWFQN